MAKLVEELQKDCLNPEKTVSALLQKARFIAKKLDKKEMVDYCTFELEGYTKGPVPEYRKVPVTYKALNPYRGWIPVDIPSPLSYMLNRSLFLSIGEMEDFLKKDETTMMMSVDAEIQERLYDLFGTPVRFEMKCFFSKTQFVRVLDTVKNKISDWALDLERKEILGDEYQFTEQEKDVAKTMTVIINGNVNGANVVGNMINSSATVNNNDKIDFESLKQLVKQVKKELEKEQNADSGMAVTLTEKVELLEQSIENRDEGSVIDTLKNIAIGAIASGIWQVGAMVSSYISTIIK